MERVIQYSFFEVQRYIFSILNSSLLLKFESTTSCLLQPECSRLAKLATGYRYNNERNIEHCKMTSSAYLKWNYISSIDNNWLFFEYLIDILIICVRNNIRIEYEQERNEVAFSMQVKLYIFHFWPSAPQELSLRI